MTREQMLLISSMKSALLGATVELPDAIDWRAFAHLVSIHNVAPLVWQGIQNNPSFIAAMPPHMSSAFKKAYLFAFHKDTQRDALRQTLTKELNALQVSHAWLKGIVLKGSYPEPALRTMSDMDALVHTEDFKKIAQIAKRLGGTSIPGDGNHQTYSFPGDIKMEFHPNLLHHDTAVGTGINPGWQYSIKKPGTYEEELSPIGFYLHVLCHLAGHFIGNGISVRFIADVWVCRHLKYPDLDQIALDKELDQLGLLDFAHNIEDLSEVWFSDKQPTPITDELAEYIFSLSGEESSDRSLLNAMSLSPSGSRTSALWKQAFHSRAEMEDRYPWCKGKAWLLPAAWVARAFRAVTIHGRHIRHWVSQTKQFSQEEIDSNLKQLNRWGIHPDHSE